MRRQIDPTVDVVFKEILGSEHHRHLLIHFLNAILGFPPDRRVVDVVLRSPFTAKAFSDDKLCIVDVKAWDQRMREFQIEIQVRNDRYLPERMLYNWCSLYSTRIAEGESYKDLEPLVAIWLLVDAVPSFPRQHTSTRDDARLSRAKSSLVHLPFGIYCAEADCFLSNHFSLHVLQLKNLPVDDTISDDKGRWLNFFRHGKHFDLDDPPEWMETPEMREAMSVLRRFSEREENYFRYLSRLDKRRTEQTVREELVEERAAKESERAAKEKAMAESARLRAYLRRSGIDPDAIPDASGEGS